MTPEQATRLIEAVDSFSSLVRSIASLRGERMERDPVEDIIEVCSGHAAKATVKLTEEQTMPRGRKKKNTDVAANSPTHQVVEAIPGTSVTGVMHVAVPADQTQLITEWKQAAEQLREVKAKENAMRQAIVANMFNAMTLEGTEAVDIGWGYKLKAVKEMNYTATNKNGETEALISALEERGADELAGELIVWKPDVAKRAYRKVLDMAQQYNDTAMLQCLHQAISVKPGLPQLELVAPGQEIEVESPSTAQPPSYILEQNFLPE